MIVICEECGKKYRIDPSKIKGKAASFKCRVCTHVIMVTKPEIETPQPVSSTMPTDTVDSEANENRTLPPSAGMQQPSAGMQQPSADLQQKGPAFDRVITKPPRKKGRFGVRAKMLLLFVFFRLQSCNAVDEQIITVSLVPPAELPVSESSATR